MSENAKGHQSTQSPAWMSGWVDGRPDFRVVLDESLALPAGWAIEGGKLVVRIPEWSGEWWEEAMEPWS